MIEAEMRPRPITLERGKIRRKLLNRMASGEVLVVTDFEDLLDLGVKEEGLHHLPNVATGKYKDDTLFFNITVTPIRFEETITRIDEKRISYQKS